MGRMQFSWGSRGMRRTRAICVAMLLCVYCRTSVAQSSTKTSRQAKPSAAVSWKFAVSGDSRNCGDVVMPAIAAGAKKNGAAFYWHLGDLRKISDIDEDILHQPKYVSKPLSKPAYEDMAWNDFVENQAIPFGNMPFYLGIGNHETVPPKTRDQFILQFADWLDRPDLRAQRLKDDPRDFRVKTYYHWIENGIDFINMDNSVSDQFEDEQVMWLEKVLQADSSNPGIHTVVAGMHEALPESISKDHSMNESHGGAESGARVYADLLKTQNEEHKRVYVLASHSHYYMDGIFNTEYWRAHGGVLPGWIIGTAGAQRYALPKDYSGAKAAETKVYGYLLATAKNSGEINFQFVRFSEQDIPPEITQRYTPEFVHWCFAENSAF